MPSTLYISIRGDYTEFQKDLARVRAIAKQNGEAISNALNNAISPDKAVKSINRLTQSLRQAHDAATSGGMAPAIKGSEELTRFADVSERHMPLLAQAMREELDLAAEDPAHWAQQAANRLTNGPGNLLKQPG